MRRLRRVAVVLAGVAVGGLVGCGDDGPTGPTPPPPPQAGLIVLCPSAVSTVTTVAAGLPVTYTAAAATGGVAPVTVSCTPASGSLFPIGTTRVSCTARDANAATASCGFDVTVAPNLRITRTRFMAFGDSITAGEVTVPVGTTSTFGTLTTLFKQIVVPTASYPSVLQARMAQRYPSQTIVVENQGRPGESATVAPQRLLGAFNASRPEVLLLMEGYNDLGSSSSVTDALSALTVMANGARDRGARVFLGTLAPGIAGRQRSQPVANLLAYNTGIRSLAASSGAVLVDVYQAGLPNVNAWIGVDGLHPTEAGYAAIAEVFFQAIRTELEVR